MTQKFKIGDKLICIPEGDHGSGWEYNRVGTVARIEPYYTGTIYWFNEFSNGVYENSLALYIPPSPENIQDKLLKVGLDGIELLKELKNRKEQEIIAIDIYLKSIEDLLNPPEKSEEKSEGQVEIEEKPEPEQEKQEESDSSDPKESAPKSKSSKSKVEKSSAKESGSEDGAEKKGISKELTEEEEMGKDSASSGEKVETDGGSEDSKFDDGYTEEEYIEEIFETMVESDKSDSLKEWSFHGLEEAVKELSKLGIIKDPEEETEKEYIPKKEKIYCGVCKKEHTRGTHD